MELVLKNGATIPVRDIDLDSFINLKDLIAGLVMRVASDVDSVGRNSDTTAGIRLLAMVVKSATADDLIKLFGILTGNYDADFWRTNFAPSLVTQAVRVAIDLLGAEFGSFLGEARGLAGQ